MLPETYLYVLINVIFSVNVVLGTLQNSFVKQRTDDLACDNSSTPIELGTVGNVIACSRICSSTSGCLGFYFNEANGACWGSNQTQCQNVADTVFYRKDRQENQQTTNTTTPACDGNCTSTTDCGVPMNFPNTVVSVGGTFEGNTRTYSCSPGYVLRNAVTLDTTCQPDATWSTPSFGCLWDCGSPSIVANSTFSGGDTVEGTIRTYTCNVGYVLIGTASTTCQTGTTWSALAFSCLRDCGAPFTIPNTDVSAGGTLEGETRTFSCSSGYVLRNAFTLDTTCQPDATWSTPSFGCLWDCGSPTIVTNAAVSGGDTVEGTIRTYTCNVGYVLSGSASTTCQTGTTWSAVAFSCLRDCGAPSAIANTVVSAGGTLEGHTRTYTCLPGYVLRNAVTLDTTCQPNSAWSTPSFDCLWDCGAPPSVGNASVLPGDTIEGTVREYECNDGYGSTAGTSLITCQAQSTWTAVGMTCVIDCYEPPAIANTTVAAGNTLEGSIRNYTCIQESIVSAPPVSTVCQPDGTWTNVDLQCLTGECPPEWLQIGSSCYIVAGNFEIPVVNSTTFCQTTYPALNASMLQLETAEEDSAAVSNILQNCTTYVCLGLHVPLMNNNTWEWMSTNEPLTYSNWIPGQPIGPPFIFVVVSADHNYQWGDCPVSFTCQPVCEISLL